MINTKLGLNQKRSIFVNLSHHKDFHTHCLNISLLLCLLSLFSSCQSTLRFTSSSNKDQPDKTATNSSLSKNNSSNNSYNYSELNLMQSKIVNNALLLSATTPSNAS